MDTCHARLVKLFDEKFFPLSSFFFFFQFRGVTSVTEWYFCIYYSLPDLNTLCPVTSASLAAIFCLMKDHFFSKPFPSYVHVSELLTKYHPRLRSFCWFSRVIFREGFHCSPVQTDELKQHLGWLLPRILSGALASGMVSTQVTYIPSPTPTHTPTPESTSTSKPLTPRQVYNNGLGF